MFERHKILETKSIVLLFAILFVVSIGGLVEIAPLFWLKSVIEPVTGMRPYTPLELAGRDVYIREGCYTCHSQQIRTLKDEVDRYGPYSLAAESMYDHPFQWGSKRNGPDLARVGEKYSDQWHVQHLYDPTSVVTGSIMPGYPFLLEKDANLDTIQSHLKALAIAGVPYDAAQIEHAAEDMAAQASADPESDAALAMLSRYEGAKIRDYDGNPDKISEMDALIAYLQMLGTLIKDHPLKALENEAAQKGTGS